MSVSSLEVGLNPSQPSPVDMNNNLEEEHLMVGILSEVQNIEIDRKKTKIDKYGIWFLQLISLKSNHPIHKQKLELLPLLNECPQFLQTSAQGKKVIICIRSYPCITKRP